MAAGIPIVEVPALHDYYVDSEFIAGMIADGPTKTLAFRRLRYLEAQFQLYILLNEAKESEEQKVQPVGRRTSESPEMPMGLFWW